MTQTLRSILESGRFVTAPGVFEMLSAKIADRMGFAALYMTGYGISASHLGLADAGLVTYTDMVSRPRTIVEGTSTPLIADADHRLATTDLSPSLPVAARPPQCKEATGRLCSPANSCRFSS